MKSTKILTINPQPAGVNQKLVPAKKYNELWDDVKEISDLTNSSDYGFPKSLSFTVFNGLSSSISGGSDTCYASAKDFINGVHYTGSDVLYFAITLAPATPSANSWYTDPRKAYVSAAAGTNVVNVNIYIRQGPSGPIQSVGTYFTA